MWGVFFIGGARVKVFCVYGLPIVPKERVRQLVCAHVPADDRRTVYVCGAFLFQFYSQGEYFVFVFSLCGLSRDPPLTVLPVLSS